MGILEHRRDSSAQRASIFVAGIALVVAYGCGAGLLAVSTVSAQPSNALTSRVRSPASDPAIAAILDFVLAPRNLRRLTPDNASEQLARFAPSLRESGRNESNLELASSEKQAGVVQQVTVSFSRVNQRWRFHALVVVLALDAFPGLYREVQKALDHRKGKRAWVQSNEGSASTVAWHLGGRMEIVLQPIDARELWLVAGEPDGEAE